MIKECIAKLVEKKDLSKDECREAFDEIMQSKASEAQIASLITALRMKGETIEEIIGAAESMKAVVAKVEPKTEDYLLDVVGTGGDKKSTFNVSTCSAIVASAAGCLVAKHGNKSVSSNSGAADVLSELGVNIELDNETNTKLIEKIGIAFMFAPKHHPAMKYAIGPRKEIGIRTIFNILGPITNPAHAQTFLLGVYSKELAEKLANVLAGLGIKKALVVHGFKGEDELSISGPSYVFEAENEKVKGYTISPTEVGLKEYPEEEIKAKDQKESARSIKEIFDGKEQGAKREIILLNAGAAIYANGKAQSIKEGIKIARKAIDSGKAKEKLEQLVKESNA